MPRGKFAHDRFAGIAGAEHEADLFCRERHGTADRATNARHQKECDQQKPHALLPAEDAPSGAMSPSPTGEKLSHCNKAPSSKLQHPEKSQIPSSKSQRNLKLKIPNLKSGSVARERFGIWSLVFPSSLELVVAGPRRPKVGYCFSLITFCIVVGSSSRSHSMIATGRLPFLIRSSWN